MTPHEVLRRPVITEKNTQLNEQARYVFEVAREANKLQIKQAVEAIFNVKVTKISTLNRKGKVKRNRRSNTFGKRPDTKRAIVAVASDDRIDIFGS